MVVGARLGIDIRCRKAGVYLVVILNDWVTNYFMKNAVEGPEVFIIDFWDLETRKKKVIEFLQGKLELVNNRFKIGL